MKKLTIITTILLCITLFEIQVYVSYQGVSKLKRSLTSVRNSELNRFEDSVNSLYDTKIQEVNFRKDSLKIEEMKLKLKKVEIGTNDKK